MDMYRVVAADKLRSSRLEASAPVSIENEGSFILDTRGQPQLNEGRGAPPD